MSTPDRKEKDYKKRIKTMKGRRQTHDPTLVNPPIGDRAKDDSNLIHVGGIADFHEEKRRLKTFKELRQETHEAWLNEKKNQKKRKSKNPSTESDDPRSKKIRDLKNRDDSWRGLR